MSMFNSLALCAAMFCATDEPPMVRIYPDGPQVARPCPRRVAPAPQPTQRAPAPAPVQPKR